MKMIKYSFRKIQTYDVKTLYTKLPHEDLISKISELLYDISKLNNRNIAVAKRFNHFIIVYGNSIDNNNQHFDKICTITEIIHSQVPHQ